MPMKKEKREIWKKRGIFVLVMLLALTGSFQYISGYVTISSNVNGKEMPIYSVETDEKKVALTFDATWGNENTQEILESLEKYNCHATFFVTGDWVRKYPDDVKLIHDAGHDLGNYSENHKNMAQLSQEEQREEIQSVHEQVKQLTGVDMNLFRAPYGAYDDSVILTAADCGYYPIQWSVDSLDWKDYGASSIVETVLRDEELKNGAIILCHHGAKYITEALDSLISGLIEREYQIVPVSELIYKEDYHMDVRGRQIQD